jgi:hypothetical protein
MAEATGTIRSTYAGYEDTNDPEVIRTQIEETRAQMSETVDAIQERLSPSRLTQEAKDKIKEATKRKVDEMAYKAKYKANNWRHGLVETIKENPVPAALAGIGLGWLLMKGTSRRSTDEEYRYIYGQDTHRLYTPEYEYEYATYSSEQEQPGFFERAQQSAAAKSISSAQHRAGEMAEQMRDKTKETMHNAQATASAAAQTVKEKASEVAGSVQETASDVANSLYDTAAAARERTREARHQARYYSHQAKRSFQYQLSENPLAMGAVAVAAGTVIGLMLPSTQKEDELMGETRDHLMEQAQTTAKETMQKAKHVAEEATYAATEAARETAKEEAKKQGLSTQA